MNAGDEAPIDLFIEECSQAMVFLVREHGFTGPIIERPFPGLIKVAYLKGDVGIECVYEERDDDVSVFLMRLSDGVKPECFKRNEDGNIIRARLTELLIQKGVRDLGLVEVEGDIEAPLQDSVRQQILKRYADLIAKYAPEVLTGSANIFQLTT